MAVREILFDTETTGFDPFSGDRLVEIGCVVMQDKILQRGEDARFHQYVNPERDVPESAIKIHGITTDFLQDKPVFAEIGQAFLEFVGSDSVLVAHNAEFDMKFINYELEKMGLKPLPKDRFVDTLAIARTKFPGQANSLDALCKRFDIENGHRTLHGALLDAEILADVYIELTVGRQAGMMLEAGVSSSFTGREKKVREKRSFTLSVEEEAQHRDFVSKELKKPIWYM